MVETSPSAPTFDCWLLTSLLWHVSCSKGIRVSCIISKCHLISITTPIYPVVKEKGCELQTMTKFICRSTGQTQGLALIDFQPLPQTTTHLSGCPAKTSHWHQSSVNMKIWSLYIKHFCWLLLSKTRLGLRLRVILSLPIFSSIIKVTDCGICKILEH